MYSFWAWYSFSMSFWRVPPRAGASVPALSAAGTYMAKHMAAGELIVIDVVVAPRSMPAKRSSASARVSTATPHRPTSPSRQGSSESRPIRVGRSKATDSPSPPGPQELAEADVGVLGRAEPGEHPHGPQLRAVHRRVRPPGVGVRTPGHSAVPPRTVAPGRRSAGP